MIGITSGDGENLECLRLIPIAGVCEPFQCLKSLPCSSLFEAESATVSTGLERFQLRLPSVEVISDSGDLLREHMVSGEFAAQPPVSFSVAVLDKEAVMR